MIGYLVRRMLFSVLLVAVVSSAALLLTGAAPGDIMSEQVGLGATARSLDAERARLGLDRPAAERFARWASRAARLDFGTSLMYGRPVAGLVAERAANTAVLAAAALLLALVVGIPLGVVSGSRRGPASSAIRAASLVALSLPTLVSSLLLVLLAARTGWLPVGGMRSIEPLAEAGPLAQAADVARHLVLPAVALALPIAAMIERLQSGAIAATLGERFVAAAVARGVPPGRLLWRNALKPSLRPVAAVFGVVFGNLLSGSFIVEIVASWPGLGRLMFDALRSRDLYLVAGCAAAGGAFLALGAILSDLALAAIDPRLRGREEAGA
ncbi:MAG TPA: ABC transporter permease [Vicinamibacterales bacterium]|nr:ABC transporter permease [Vicinamibacterales bacterium]HPW19817.1 ABC transporter permease [Vicinamibacterales bacterium]